MESFAFIFFGLAHSDSREGEKDLLVGLRDHSLTCPQTDNNTHVLSISLHNNGSQDLAAEQGGLETVGQSIEAPVAQHSYLVVEGAASERKLWDRGSVGTTEPCLRPHTSVGRRVLFSHPTPQTCTLLRPRLKPRHNSVSRPSQGGASGTPPSQEREHQKQMS